MEGPQRVEIEIKVRIKLLAVEVFVRAVVAVWASWKFGGEVDNSSYDELFRNTPASSPM